MAKKQSKSNTQKQGAAKVTDNKVPEDQAEVAENSSPDTAGDTQNELLGDQTQAQPESKDNQEGESQDQSLDDKTQAAPESKDDQDDDSSDDIQDQSLDDQSPPLAAAVANVVRVTSPINIGDKTYQPNNLVRNLPKSVFDTLLEKKRISQCEAGIKYCKDTLQEKVIDHAE